MNEKQKKALGAKFSDCRKSSRMFSSTISEWYDAKHREASAEEIEFVNSIAIVSCPYCGSKEIRKDGRSKKAGLAMRECKECGRKFSPLTGSVFDSRKIPLSEWIEFLVHLFQFHSVRTSSFDNRNADSTGLYWLSKVFAALDGYQDGTVLSGRVWIGETYFPKWPSETGLRGGKAPPRAFQKPILRLLRDRRKEMRPQGLRRREAEQKQGRQSLWRIDRPGIDDNPRRRQFP